MLSVGALCPEVGVDRRVALPMSNDREKGVLDVYECTSRVVRVYAAGMQSVARAEVSGWVVEMEEGSEVKMGGWKWEKG